MCRRRTPRDIYAGRGRGVERAIPIHVHLGTRNNDHKDNNDDNDTTTTTTTTPTTPTTTTTTTTTTSTTATTTKLKTRRGFDSARPR